MVYMYDGLLDGFLTCIFEHYYTMKATEIRSISSGEQLTLEETKWIETDPIKASRVHKAMIEKLSLPVYEDIFYTFLSNDPLKDNYLLEYIVLAFQMGPKIYGLHTEGVANKIKKLSHKVGGERHRFLGLLRFMDTGSFLYAAFEPEHNILMTLADHFADRYANERFIIHDKRRKKAIVGNFGKTVLVDFDYAVDSAICQEEDLFQELWKIYFNTIGIDYRKNLQLQQHFVPLKYQKNVLEFNQNVSDIKETAPKRSLGAIVKDEGESI